MLTLPDKTFISNNNGSNNNGQVFAVQMDLFFWFGEVSDVSRICQISRNREQNAEYRRDVKVKGIQKHIQHPTGVICLSFRFTHT
jgi:hypothetical protein